MINKFLIFLAFAGVMSCAETYTPKPRTYPKIEYPERTYQTFDVNYCAFSFEYPTYMAFVRDTSFLGQKPKHNCWFNLDIPKFNGVVHFTYTPVHNANDVYQAYDDAYRLASQHNKKADSNMDYVFKNDSAKVYGILYEIGGHVASAFQFVLTDSTHHSVRGALYFNSHPNPDSLRPILNFVKEDLSHILKTFKWTNRK